MRWFPRLRCPAPTGWPYRAAGAAAPSAASADAGYALAEMVVAGTVIIGLALPAYAMLRRTLDVADLVATRFAQNAQARQIAALLADGSTGSTAVSGFHNRKAGNSPSQTSFRSNYQFRLSDPSYSTAQPVYGDKVAPRSIACLAALVPFPDCTGTETQPKQVAGWVSNDPASSTTGPNCTSGTGCTVQAYTFSLTSPFRAARAKTAAAAGTEQYRMQFNLNVEQ